MWPFGVLRRQLGQLAMLRIAHRSEPRPHRRCDTGEFYEFKLGAAQVLTLEAAPHWAATESDHSTPKENTNDLD